MFEQCASVLSNLLRECGSVTVIGGGLATDLEQYGADLNDPLWSAKCLINSLQLVRQLVDAGIGDEGIVFERNDLSLKIKLEQVHGAWLPPWLVAHLIQSQSFVARHWNEYGKPVANVAMQKVLMREKSQKI